MGFENSNLYSCIKDVMVFLGDNSLTGDKRLKGVLILSDDLLLDGSHIFWYNLAFSRGVVFYYHNDHLGTPQVMTDITGNIVWKADYEPFGKVNIVVENIENNFRFPGQYYISETGLYYNWWRWYKSEIGRYMSIDKCKYCYSKLNPFVFIDPSGLECYLIGIDYDIYRKVEEKTESNKPWVYFDIHSETWDKIICYGFCICFREKEYRYRVTKTTETTYEIYRCVECDKSWIEKRKSGEKSYTERELIYSGPNFQYINLPTYACWLQGVWAIPECQRKCRALNFAN